MGFSAAMPFHWGIDLFALLAMGHCVGDFALQSDRMAVEKCPGRDVTLGWGWWLAAHSGIHGFLVAVITGMPLLGLAEWAAHALVDFGKCRKCYSLAIDQIFHLLCKFAWTMAALAFAT